MKRLDIAVGVLRRRDGKILITQRRADTHFEGWWEFPGGKFEPDEGIDQALKRELSEELGIRVSRSRPLITVNWQYPERRVRLYTRLLQQSTVSPRWRCDWFDEPWAREGQAMRWVATDELWKVKLLPADWPIVDALTLPKVYLITPDPAQSASRETFINALKLALANGHRLVRLRAHSLPDQAYFDLALQVCALCREYKARLMLDRSVDMVRAVGAQGLHLTSHALKRVAWQRQGLPKGLLIAASCHSPTEIQLAESIQARFLVLSPIKKADGHPGRLGWRQFSRWIDRAAIPVYALGGMSALDAECAISLGGQGVAGISGFWPKG